MIFGFKETITPKMDVNKLISDLCEVIKRMATERPSETYRLKVKPEDFPNDEDIFEEFVFDTMDNIDANLLEFYQPADDIFDSYFKFVYSGVEMKCYLCVDSYNNIDICVGFTCDCECRRLATLFDD